MGEDLTMWPHRNREDHSELESLHDQATDAVYQHMATLQDDAFRLGWTRGRSDVAVTQEYASKILTDFMHELARSESGLDCAGSFEASYFEGWQRDIESGESTMADVLIAIINRYSAHNMDIVERFVRLAVPSPIAEN